jgi:hypothetical protein
MGRIMRFYAAAKDGRHGDGGCGGTYLRIRRFLAKDRLLPAMKRGERLAVMTAGAYGYVLSSQYNLRPRAAEVMVQADGWHWCGRGRASERT